MHPMSPADALEQFSQGNPAPVYLIVGDDATEMAETAGAFEEAVEEALRPFNVDRFDGGDDKVTLRTVMEAARMLPMMAPRRVVIVQRAKDCLMPKRESQTAEKDQEAFEAYLSDPQPHATLVLVAGNLDKRRRLVKSLFAAAVVVTCGVVENLADAEQWVRRRVAASGSTIPPAAAQLLAASTGPDFGRLRGDVERLLLFTAGQSAIALDDVRAIAGPATMHDDWAVARAIERGQAGLALRELALAVESGVAPYMVLGQLAWVVRTKLSSDRLPAAVEVLFRADLDLKSSVGEPRVLLERLVMELCGVSGTETGRPGALTRHGAEP